MITLIAAVGKNYELGKHGELIWHLPRDLQFFKETTRGKVIVMGRKTFESIGRPLPKRTNIVLTTRRLDIDGVQIMKTLDEVLEQFHDVVIIGGEAVYRQTISRADAIILTEIDAEDSEADTFFPVFKAASYHRTILDTCQENGIRYAHVIYTKK